MFVMGCYGHKLSNGVLFAHHLIAAVAGERVGTLGAPRNDLIGSGDRCSVQAAAQLGILLEMGAPLGGGLRCCGPAMYKYIPW